METDMGGILSTAQAYAALCQGDMLKARKLLELGNEKFLAHLSLRLIGELIVYEGIRRPSVVRLSTFSNDISSEAVRRILFIFHL